jgi:RimJ/RimL family protein N-acetyltransferase
MNMPSASPYDRCPVYETEHFILRLINADDAADLLECYSDPAAVEVMNSDRCTSNFHYTTIEEMSKCINFWLEEYERKSYVRFSVLDKKLKKAIGTIEFFGGDYGVLRIDIKHEYEKTSYLSELLRLSNRSFHSDFKTENIIVKAIPKAGERIQALQKNGFAPDDRFRPGLDYYLHVK